MEIIGNITGFLALLISFFIFQQKSRKRVLIFKLADDILWFAHFVFLNGITGAVVTCIAILREVVFVNSVKDNKRDILSPCLFSILLIISGIVTWEGFYSIFPVFNSVLSTFAFQNTNAKKLKILSVPGAIGMIIYSLKIKSLSSLFAQIIILVSISVFYLTDKKIYVLNKQKK